MSFTPAKSGQRLPQLRARQPQVYGHGPFALDLHDCADLPIRAAGQVQEQQGAEMWFHPLQSIVEQIDIVQTLFKRGSVPAELSQIGGGHEYGAALPLPAPIP